MTAQHWAAINGHAAMVEQLLRRRARTDLEDASFAATPGGWAGEGGYGAFVGTLLKHRMTLSSCLEEILLHTNERLGDGVASPHTRRTLDHIRQLKAKHGIDYDCHASYRFVEKA